MLFYRRKLLLSLLQELGGEIPAVDFQKYLFLLSQEQKQASFEFVPYKFGCFSFQSYADKRSLQKTEVIDQGEPWKISSRQQFITMLSADDQKAVSNVVKQYSKLKGNKLVKYVYERYPFYATRSEIAHKLLSQEQMNKVQAEKPSATKKQFFSIGYEGKSIDLYLKQLLTNNVKALCDVRKNPLSRKYGFSKNQLKTCLNSVGIDYFAFKELGIESADRKSLTNFSDYQRLFDSYERKTLPKHFDKLDELLGLLSSHKRVAFTCFEADHKWCHRSRVANMLETRNNLRDNIIHL